MDDEWDTALDGRSFTKTNFDGVAGKNNSSNGGNDDEWNDSTPVANNNDYNDKPRGDRYNSDGGGGRRGYGGGGGGGRDRENRDNRDNRNGGDRNGGDRNGGGFRNRNGGGGGFERGGGRRDENGDDGGQRRFGRDRDNDDNRGGDDRFNNRDRDRNGFKRDKNEENNENGDDKPEKPREIYVPPAPTDNEEEIFGNAIVSGINFAKYDKIPVNVSKGAPNPILSFENSGLKPYLLDNIRKSGYTVPTPIQKHAIPIIMGKRDLMACAQTGSGKTAAFLLPIINDLLSDNRDLQGGNPHVIIISPTRELTIQIFNEARKFSMGSYLKSDKIYGGTSVRHQGEHVAKGVHILVCTPGRLVDFVDRGFVSFSDVRFIVLDEADRMLDLGFMPTVEKLMAHETMPSNDKRQTLMFSATFPEDIQRLAGKFLNDYVFAAVGIVGGACTDVEQEFIEVPKFKKRSKLTEILENCGTGGTIVFVETKRTADFLASLLSETKFPTTSIHGDRLQREREEALNDFKSGKMSVLIATSVAARGLDIKNVGHVINYDLPKCIDDYVHRIGRTGRVGNRGKATSFFDPEQDAALVADLQKILKQADQKIPDFLMNGGASGGGSGDFSKSFGGRDVRNYRKNPLEVDNFDRVVSLTEPKSQEPEEEEW